MRNVKQLIALAKTRPDQIFYSTSGRGTVGHLAAELLNSSAGIKLVHVPYTGAGPAIVGLLGGQVDALATGPASIVQHVKGGKVRVLAHWGDVRLVALPDVAVIR